MQEVLQWLGLGPAQDKPAGPHTVPATDPDSVPGAAGTRGDDCGRGGSRWVRRLHKVGVAGQVLALLLVCTAGGAAGNLAVEAAGAAITAGRELLGLGPDVHAPCWQIRPRPMQPGGPLRT